MSAAEMTAGMFRYESREFGGPMQIASSARCTASECASASLYTTTVWTLSSRQARITLTAISPRFAMRTLSNTQCLLERRGIAYARGRRLGDDALREPRQHVTGAELDEPRRALPLRAAHGSDPSYRRPHLLLEQLREVARVLVRLGVDIRDDRVAQRRERRSGDRLAQLRRHGSHRRGVKRRRNAQREHALGAGAFQRGGRGVERRERTGDDDLARRVVVRDDEPRVRDGALDSVGVQPDDRGHAARGICRLHELTAPADEARRIGERERPRGDECTELAERVSEAERVVGGKARLERDAQRGDRGDEDGGLGVRGLIELR